MSEKIDIATELVFSSVANIVSDWQAALNAVELVLYTIHIKENSEIKMNLFLFLLKFEDNILLSILATSNKESTNVIVVLDKFAFCDIAIGHIWYALTNNKYLSFKNDFYFTISFIENPIFSFYNI